VKACWNGCLPIELRVSSLANLSVCKHENFDLREIDIHNVQPNFAHCTSALQNYLSVIHGEDLKLPAD